MLLSFRASGAITSTTPTFNPNGIGPTTIVKSGGLALDLGDISNNTAEYFIRYNLANTRWELLNPSTLTGAISTTLTFNGSGGSSGSITLTFQRFGKMVLLNIPAVTGTTGTSSTTFTSNTALPASVRPASSQTAPITAIQDNGAGMSGVGLIVVSTAGILTIYRDSAATAFTNSAVAGTSQAQSIVYYIP